MTGPQPVFYALKPRNVLKMQEFMEKAGSIKRTPKSINELFFPDAAALAGD
jgi:hypothetical protein